MKPRWSATLQLTSDPAWDESPVWSPDGQKIAFGRRSESEVAIFTISSSGGGERKLLSLGPRTKWDQLGSGLFDFARRLVTQVATVGQDIFLNGLAVSPDRRQILYTREDDTGGVDIWLVENFR